MGENLLEKLFHKTLDLQEFFSWLKEPDCQDSKFQVFTEKHGSRSEFVTFFLNFVHEELASKVSEGRAELEETKSSEEISTVDNELEHSTPKVSSIKSDLHISPVSPIYKHSFSTPNRSMCLGDFIVSKKVSSRKKRRIKPTNLSQTRINDFENSFNFSAETNEFPLERNDLAERVKILSRDLSVSASAKCFNKSYGEEIVPEENLVTNKESLDLFIRIYDQLLNNSYVINLAKEIYFLINLLLKKQFYTSDWGVSVLSEQILCNLFNTIHNIIYFASKTLELQVKVLKNFDNSTLRLLTQNERIQAFAPLLVKELHNLPKKEGISPLDSLPNNTYFNSDTDNRLNFPNDPSFHAFRKQRDLFYEILRIWDTHHLATNFSFSLSLTGKIKTLFSLSSEPTNFVHFSRLFKAQFLNTCKSGDDFVTSLDIDAQKLNKLKNRCITKSASEGFSAPPSFSEGEEFYRDFVVVASNHAFNRHLCDVLIEEIVELNESDFEEETDFVTRKQYYACLKKLRTLAKFLGFVEAWPYKSDCAYNENLMSTHLKVRRQIAPCFDIKSILEASVKRKSLILCIPWLVQYLAMLDPITLKLPYFTQIQTSLFWIYRNFDWAPDSNVYLIKFTLGWFFELPHLTENAFLHLRTEEPTFQTNSCLDHLDIVDQDILYFCCPYLEEIKKLLSNSSSHTVSIKHITPITALQSPEEIARKRIDSLLEEAFFNSQPISLRKTVEFVSERVASTCVKHICNAVVPKHRKMALEKLKSELESGEDRRSKANQIALVCLKELEEDCNQEVTLICEEKVDKAIDSLLSFDVLPQTKRVCTKFTKKGCLDRIRQWISGHINASVFSKDFNEEVQSAGPKPKKPVFILPSNGSNPNHNEEAVRPSHLVEKFRVLTLRVIEKNQISSEDVVSLLDCTLSSVEERGDFNECVLATLCCQLRDLHLLLLAHDSSLLWQDGVLAKSSRIWRLFYSGCDDLFKTLLSPRNVQFFALSSDKPATWNSFARFCVLLIEKGLLSSENFESQCTGIFRRDWDEENLKLITEFLRTFVRLYRGSDLTFLLNFLSDFCDDL